MGGGPFPPASHGYVACEAPRVTEYEVAAESVAATVTGECTPVEREGSAHLFACEIYVTCQARAGVILTERRALLVPEPQGVGPFLLGFALLVALYWRRLRR